MKILLVFERWRDCHPKSSHSDLFHNLLGSLQESNLAECGCLHYDEYFHKNNSTCDNYLIKTVMEEKPDMVVFCFVPWYEKIPQLNTINTLSNFTKCVFVWPDGVAPHHMEMANKYNEFASLSIVWDVDVSWYPGTKFVHLWTPQDPRIFHDPNLDRHIDVSFIGKSEYYDRKRYLDYLQGKVNLLIEGGDNGKMSVYDYAKLMQRSKISLNFSLNSLGNEQLKGRIFEITSCGAMLMESSYKHNWINRWFQPMIHYVPFINTEDLLDKVKYYLSHEDERKTIASNGWRRTTEWYNNVSWWKYVFQECGLNA